MDWKEIETAPKDGRSIIVIGFSDNTQIPVTVFWADDSWNIDGGENCFIYTYQSIASSMTSGVVKLVGAPTYWSDLPEEPKVSLLRFKRYENAVRNAHYEITRLCEHLICTREESERLLNPVFKILDDALENQPYHQPLPNKPTEAL